MPWRATSALTSRLAATAMSHTLRASSRPTAASYFCIDARGPSPSWPPLRPEAPQPMRLASMSATS